VHCENPRIHLAHQARARRSFSYDSPCGSRVDGRLFAATNGASQRHFCKKRRTRRNRSRPAASIDYGDGFRHGTEKWHRVCAGMLPNKSPRTSGRSAERSVTKSLTTGNAFGGHGSMVRVGHFEMAHVQLARGGALMVRRGERIDDQRTHAANATRGNRSNAIGPALSKSSPR